MEMESPVGFVKSIHYEGLGRLFFASVSKGVMSAGATAAFCDPPRAGAEVALWIAGAGPGAEASGGTICDIAALTPTKSGADGAEK